LKRIVLSVLLALLVLATSTAYAQARTVVWQRWDVVIDNVDTTANTFTVTEIYDVRFYGTFSYGEAIIPVDRLDSIRNIEVRQDGVALRQSCGDSSGAFCSNRVQEGISIVYYFERPVTSESVNIELRYTVDGALRVYEGGDQLWWIAVPEEKFGFPVRASTLTVRMPPGFAPREGVDPVVTYGAPADVQVNGTVITATALEGVQPNQAFEIRVQYPHDPNARAAAWQSGFDQQRAFEETFVPWLSIGGIVLGALLALGGPIGVYYLWFSRGRDPKIGPVPEYLSEPPSDLPPALVGTLVDENAEMRDIVSTLIDLAERGFVEIEEIDGLIRDSHRFKLNADKPLTELRRFEQRFLKAVFRGGKTEIEMNDLKNKFYTAIPGLQKALYEDMVAEGFFKNSPSKIRTRWTSAAVTTLFAGIGLLMVMIGAMEDILIPALMCIPAGIVMSGLAMLLGASAMPSKTPKGALEAAKWSAFREYMQNLQKYGKVEEAAERFSKYLPYAIAFGFERSWIRRFSQLETVPAPPWYHRPYGRRTWWGGRVTPTGSGGLPSAGDLRPGDIATAGGDGMLNDMAGGLGEGLNNMADGLTRMLNSASQTFNSRPQASSGSSGSWSSGGSSWSGGGFSGGGGGGGGSRGFG
jgi:uncharacterized membrane protein YgcG